MKKECYEEEVQFYRKTDYTPIIIIRNSVGYLAKILHLIRIM